MASTDRISDNLTKFLACDPPGVFAIKGAWGVGKTFFWHRYIESAALAKNCRAYAYVSMFGIGSIAELRRAIFTRHVTYGAKRSTLVSGVTKGASTLLRGVRAGVQVHGLGIEQTDIWAEMVEDKTLKNFLVCIDDLERRERDLSPSAMLGFIASLRDERQCKVVLLYNDDELAADKEMEKSLAAYREKVIDRELTYKPTVANSYRLVFGDDYRFRAQKETPSNPFHVSEKRSLLEIFESIKIANIRVMRKARDMLDYCAPEMASKYPNLWPSFARQVVKISCLHYTYSRDFAVKDVIDQKTWARIYLARDEKGKEADMTKYEPVKTIGLFAMGADPLILELLNLGYVDWTKHAKLLVIEERAHALSKLGVKLHAVWDLIWDNFSANQATFNNEMVAFIKKHGKKMNMAELSQAVEILQEFGETNPEVEKFLANKVDAYVAEAGEGALAGLHPGGLAQTAVRMIRERVDALVVKKTIPEVVALMAKPGGYFPGEVKYIAHCTEGDFYKFIASTKDKDTLSRLKIFRERLGNDEPANTVRVRFEKALTRLARESAINARRVRYGVGFTVPSK